MSFVLFSLSLLFFPFSAAASGTRPSTPVLVGHKPGSVHPYPLTSEHEQAVDADQVQLAISTHEQIRLEVRSCY